MSKDPAFLFYPADFLVGSTFLSNEDCGKYIRLLCYMHQHGRLAPEKVAQLVGDLSPDLLSKFSTDKAGNFFNKRLEFESERRTKYAESRRNNAKGATTKPKAYAKPHAEAYAKDKGERMENENETLNRTVIESKNGEGKSENLAAIDTETETTLLAFAAARTEQTETLCKNHDIQQRQLKAAAGELVSHYRAKGDGYLPKGSPYHVLNNWLLKGKQFSRNGNGKPEAGEREYDPADLAKGGKYYHPIIKRGHPDFEDMRKSVDRLKPVQ